MSHFYSDDSSQVREFTVEKEVQVFFQTRNTIYQYLVGRGEGRISLSEWRRFACSHSISGYSIRRRSHWTSESFIFFLRRSAYYLQYRFNMAISAAKWTHLPKEARRLSTACIQTDLPELSETKAFKQTSAQRFDFVHRLLPQLKSQSEDCLYMNLYVPERLGE